MMVVATCSGHAGSTTLLPSFTRPAILWGRRGDNNSINKALKVKCGEEQREVCGQPTLSTCAMRHIKGKKGGEMLLKPFPATVVAREQDGAFFDVDVVKSEQSTPFFSTALALSCATL